MFYLLYESVAAAASKRRGIILLICRFGFTYLRLSAGSVRTRGKGKQTRRKMKDKMADVDEC